MSVVSDKNRAGISTLELALGVTIVVLIGIFAVLFAGRKSDRPPQPAQTAQATSRAPDRPARGLDPVHIGSGAMDSTSKDSVLSTDNDAAAEANWAATEDAPQETTTPAYRAPAQSLAVPGDKLRAYFSGAFSVPGRPNWPTFLALVGKLEPEQFPAAWALLQEQPWSQEKQDTMKTFVEGWATRDPAAAVEFALTLESARQRSIVYGTAVETWAATDPAGALAWYEEQLASGAGRVPVSHFFAGLYASDPETALELVWETEDARRESFILRSLFFPPDADREQGALKLKALFDSSEDPDRRKLLADMVADVWAAEDPMRAIAWAAQLQDEPDVQQTIYLSAAQAWGRREPEAAMAWLEEQGLTQTDPHVLQHIARSWERDNPASLARWLESAPPSATRDAVVTSRISSLQDRTPGAAFALAESISDSANRYRAMASVADRWMHSDRTAAATAVLGSSMPAEMKRKYAMSVIPKGGRTQRAAP